MPAGGAGLQKSERAALLSHGTHNVSLLVELLHVCRYTGILWYHTVISNAVPELVLCCRPAYMFAVHVGPSAADHGSLPTRCDVASNFQIGLSAAHHTAVRDTPGCL